MLAPADIAAELTLLTNYARTLCRDSDLANDLAQETVVKAIRYRDKFDGTNLRGWLVVILRNTWLSYLRDLKDEARITPVYDDTHIVDFDGDDTLRYVRRSVRNAVTRLPSWQRDVVRCVYLEGLPYNVAAERLGIPVGTVKSRVNRAKISLQEKLRATYANA